MSMDYNQNQNDVSTRDSLFIQFHSHTSISSAQPCMSSDFKSCIYIINGAKRRSRRENAVEIITVMCNEPPSSLSLSSSSSSSSLLSMLLSSSLLFIMLKEQPMEGFIPLTVFFFMLTTTPCGISKFISGTAKDHLFVNTKLALFSKSILLAPLL
ncbi:50S ribosomal protein [Dirofilaria immitis]|nr:hypothetical protein [Dirofilaria immitis]